MKKKISIMLCIVLFALTGCTNLDETLYDQVGTQNYYNTKSDVIRAVAARESAVFVGRCADYILRENPRCVNVFLTADDADRIGRIRSRQGCTAEEARAMMERVDARRASYYNYYSSRTWGEAATYHLCVSTSPLGDEGTADFILEFAARKLNMKF